MNRQMEVLENAPEQIAVLRQKLEFINKMIGKASGDIRQEDIVDEVSSYINEKTGIELCSMPPVHNFKKQEYWVKTYSLELQGGFNELVQFLYYFEQKKSIGKISSAEFYLVKDHRTKKNYLRLKLYIQSFTKAI